MIKWNKTLDLSCVWDNDGDGWTDENVHMLGKVIAKRLKRLYKDYQDYDKYGYQLEELIDAFEDVLTIERADSINEGEKLFSPLGDFNNVMEELYDWAYGERLWINK